jgi:hypothetical protein
MDPEFLSTFEALRQSTKCSVDAAVVAASLLFVADSVESLTSAVAGRELENSNEDLLEVVADANAVVDAVDTKSVSNEATRILESTAPTAGV